MTRVISTIPVENIRSDALPRICISRKCLNSAEKGENYCTPCIEQKGIKRGLFALLKASKRHGSSRKLLRKLTKRISSYAADCTIIYCLRMGANGPIKIGRTDNIKGRIDGLQTGNPFQLIPIVEISLPAEMEWDFSLGSR